MYDEDEKEPRYWIYIVIAFVILFLLIFGVYSVPAGRVGVITRFGAIHRVVNPGVGLKIPLVEWNHRMSVQTQKVELTTGAASSNLQTVDAIVSVNYRLIGAQAARIFQEVGTDYEEIVIVPAIQQAFKSTTAQFTAEEIITDRTRLSVDAEILLQESMEPFYITIQAFNVINVDFSEEYDNSIEQKQVQEQKVEIAKLKQLEATINAETIKIEARAQSEAQTILNDTGALSQSYLQYLFLTNWNGQLPRVIGGAQPVFDINPYLDGE